jgi:dipeptidyl aminopeptidase/acylaminoacyl peptidase
MKPAVRTLIVLVVLVLARPAAAQSGRAPTVDDLLDLVQVSAPEIAPDGTRILYTRSVLQAWSENKRASTVWMVNADGTDARQLLGSDKDRNAAWSPDGQHVAFLSTRDQEGQRDAPGAQIWLLPMAGGEAMKLTDLTSGVRAFRWAADGSRLFFTAEEPQSDAEKAIRKNVGDGVFVDEGPNGQSAGRYSNLWVVTVSDKTVRQITTGQRLISSFAPSPDASRLAFIARGENRRNDSHLAEVYLADVASGVVTRLTTNEAPERDVDWSPDGSHVSFTAPGLGTWELRQHKLYTVPAAGGTPRLLSDGFDGNIGSYNWHPSGRTITLGTSVRGRSGVHVLDVERARTREVATGDYALSLGSVTRDGLRAAATFSTPATPGEIALVDLTSGMPTTITDSNAWFKDVAVAEMRAITWKSTDGLDIEGLLWLPAGHTPGTRLPLALSIHGGPAGVWSTSFRGINHVYASLGWAVLEPNVRGSTSYGDALLRGNMRDIGGGDYQDVMTGVDAVIAQGIADPGQLAVRGWSYGGILGGFALTQTTRFKAASLGAMVADWASEYAMGFNHDVRRWYIGGTPWDNPEGYRKQSAYTYIDKVTTPTLLLHGENDETCTIGQSMMYYQGLKDRDVTTRFIRFPREPHGFREPQHIRMRDAEEISWLMQHTRGIDWQAPPRQDVSTAKDEKKTDP